MAKRKEKIEEKEKGYIILSSERYLELEDMVCLKMADGYKPIGGVAVIWGRDASGYQTIILYQAMEKGDLII